MKRRRRLFVSFWAIAAIVTMLLIVNPILTTATRALMLLGLFGTWGGALSLFWKSWPARIFLLLPVVAAFGLLALPYKTVDVGALRQSYVNALKKYDGVRYLWGGESSLGIDCSGLIRRGFIDACLSEGWRTKDLGLLRTAAAIWWYDSSAQSLGEGNRTALLFLTPNLNELDDEKILPGDLAVTQSGQHILAYLGEKTWIDADPKANRVVMVKAPSKDIWLSDTPMKLVRWYRF
jgi:hypothetical protein